jgi:hypothetical protein
VKKITSIALVLILSAQCFYQLGVITYFHLNNDYIAEVLCINKEKPITMCHGKCFLNKNLDVADDAGTDKGTLPAGKKIDFPTFLVSEVDCSLNTLDQQDPGYSFYRSGISSEHSPGPFHPPAFLS